MSTRILILGAGFAGLELATRLSEELGSGAGVTLIDASETFGFGFSKLDVLLGRKEVAEVRLGYGRISKPGVSFRRERVTAIDAGARRVTTEEGTHEADILAIALGADHDIAATPGLAEGGSEYYSFEGAARMREALASFERGRIVLGILGHPFKCPPAPFEGALLLHDLLTERGVRDECEIGVYGPQAAPVPVTGEVSRRFHEALAERGISYTPESVFESIDPAAREARLPGGETVPYELFVGVPKHRVPEVVTSSGLAPDGWIPVDRANLRTSFEGVWALGDCAALPMAKAGVFAENAAVLVAEDILATLRDGELERAYEGIGSCYLEFGGGLVAKVDANFLGGPKPTARFVGPSLELAEEKREFARTRKARWFGS